MLRKLAGLDDIITERSQIRGLPLFLKPGHNINVFLSSISLTKKSKIIVPAGHDFRNSCRVSMRALFFMIMHDVMTKRKSKCCLPPCHALTVVGEKNEHFPQLK